MNESDSVTRVRAGSAADLERELGWIYRELGVEPLINCTGVRTQYGGSNPAPEVSAAMQAASHAFVDLDELAEAVGRRCSALTGAEWGIVTSGTTAALSLATAACIAGNNPELMLRLPRTDGLSRRVVMMVGQRFDYDHAIQAAGGEICCAQDVAHLDALLDESAVMVCLLGRRDEGPLSLGRIAPLAHDRAVPIVVDAAGLAPQRPDRWLAAGADLVVYAGGKYLRGPQSTGLLLGRKTLCQAAWLNGAPHQAFGRSMKVGKEEIVGALVALERWLSSPRVRHERAQWLKRLQLIDAELADVPAVTTRRMQSSEFVTAPRLRIQWDGTAIPLDSETLREHLRTARPRIAIHDFWSTSHSIVVDPVNLTDSQAVHVARAIRAALIGWSGTERQRLAASIDVGGSWRVQLKFLHREATHQLHLRQCGEHLVGEHIAQFSTGALRGSVESERVQFVAKHPTATLPCYFSFEGALRDGILSGDLHLGAATDEHLGPVFQRQFGEGVWRAERTSPRSASWS